MYERESMDSREGFDAMEYEAYFDATDRSEFDFDDDDCDEGEFDGQPDEYTEWQDLYGGDDWDHGQYDDYDRDCDFGYDG